MEHTPSPVAYSPQTPGKGLSGSCPHAAPLRMRARPALLSSGASGAAKGVFAGLDHLPFYTEGFEGGVEGRVIPNRNRYRTLPVDPRISLKTNSTQEDTGRTFREDTSHPRAIRSASVPTSRGRWSGRLELWGL